MEYYDKWKILDEKPNGWKIDKTAGSPLPRTVFITNGKSVLRGQERAILRVKPIVKEPIIKVCNVNEEIQSKDLDYKFPAKTVNELARAKFKEQLLKDISVDLMVCELEGWDKKEYIKEIKKLVNGINLNKNNKFRHPELEGLTCRN